MFIVFRIDFDGTTGTTGTTKRLKTEDFYYLHETGDKNYKLQTY